MLIIFLKNATEHELVVISIASPRKNIVPKHQKFYRMEKMRIYCILDKMSMYLLL